MARVSHMIVDGLAFVMIGVGLTATYIGAELKLPIPVVQQAKLTAGLSEPVTTGAIAEKPHHAASEPSTVQPELPAEVVSQAQSTARIWVDPPRR